MKRARCMVRRLNRSKPSARFSCLSGRIDPVIAPKCKTQEGLFLRDLKFGQRFVEIYHESKGKTRRLTVDYGRLHDTEPVGQ